MPKIELKPLFDGPRLDGVRVLLVEDDHDSREMLCKLLHTFGANCSSVSDVPAARAELLAFTPDVILTDIGLPGEDGYTLLRWLRARAQPPPIIAVSAFDRADALKAGFDAHVSKPIAISRLLQTIAVVMSKRTKAI